MWESVAQLFPDGMVDAMFEVFLGALETMATDAAAVERPTLARLAPQQAARRAAVNATAAERAPRRLETPIVQQARIAPEAVAVRQGETTLSYGALLREAEDIAGALRQSGVARGEVVAAIVAPGPRAAAALLGIVMAGAVYLPIEPSWPAARMEELLGEAGARLALLSAAGPALPVPALRLDQPLPRGDAARPHLEAGDAAYVIFTSGSTGRPKGVLIAHEAAANTIDDINQRFAAHPADRALCVSSLAFDLSVYDIFGLLAVGGEVVFPARSRDPDAMAQALSDGGVTIWNSVPAVLELMLEVSAPRSPHLRLALMSGDWIAPGLAGRLRDAFPALRPISLGGATEVSIWSVVHPIAPEDAVLASIPTAGRCPTSNASCARPTAGSGRTAWWANCCWAAAASRSPIWATRRKPSAASSSTPRAGDSTAPAISRAGSRTASLNCWDGWTGRSRCRAIGSSWARSRLPRCAPAAWRAPWPRWPGARTRR